MPSFQQLLFKMLCFMACLSQELFFTWQPCGCLCLVRSDVTRQRGGVVFCQLPSSRALRFFNRNTGQRARGVRRSFSGLEVANLIGGGPCCTHSRLAWQRRSSEPGSSREAPVLGCVVGGQSLRGSEKEGWRRQEGGRPGLLRLLPTP